MTNSVLLLVYCNETYCLSSLINQGKQQIFVMTIHYQLLEHGYYKYLKEEEELLHSTVTLNSNKYKMLLPQPLPENKYHSEYSSTSCCFWRNIKHCKKNCHMQTLHNLCYFLCVQKINWYTPLVGSFPRVVDR